MRWIHIFLAILVMGIWGFSFVAMEEGLNDMPPLLLCGLRFLLTTFPAIFFIKKPEVSWKIIASYGIFMFVLICQNLFFCDSFKSRVYGCNPMQDPKPEISTQGDSLLFPLDLLL
jgi:drug/metabolite transporter (DMT)-like permease